MFKDLPQRGAHFKSTQLYKGTEEQKKHRHTNQAARAERDRAPTSATANLPRPAPPRARLRRSCGSHARRQGKRDGAERDRVRRADVQLGKENKGMVPFRRARRVSTSRILFACNRALRLFLGGVWRVSSFSGAAAGHASGLLVPGRLMLGWQTRTCCTVIGGGPFARVSRFRQQGELSTNCVRTWPKTACRVSFTRFPLSPSGRMCVCGLPQSAAVGPLKL